MADDTTIVHDMAQAKLESAMRDVAELAQGVTARRWAIEAAMRVAPHVHQCTQEDVQKLTQFFYNFVKEGP